MTSAVGYRWLIETYGLQVVQALPISTSIGRMRQHSIVGDTEHRTIRGEQAPPPELGAQLGYALKHEGVHLELLARLFAVVPVPELESWIRTAPTGQYRRRAGYLFEAITERTLDVSTAGIGNYVQVLDPVVELTASEHSADPRWRVQDNLLGIPGLYCPQVRRRSAVTTAMALDVAARIAALEEQFSPDLIQRSAMWLSVKESRASFAIEHELSAEGRVQRFARVIEERTGNAVDPLNADALSALQCAILGDNPLYAGMRQSPVFVGEANRFGEDQVHYIAPHWEDLPGMLQGLREVMSRTRGQSAIARAAIASFGFVYLHPMVDGNGRISRFLISDTLRRDGVLPAPYILPVSALLADRALRPMNYDAALELYSRPLLQQYQGCWSFGAERIEADGVRSNFEFSAWQRAKPAWQYPDLSGQVVFLSDVIARTIDQEMHAEALYLQRHRRARANLKEILEGPDSALDRIIRSIRENRGAISGKLEAEYPRLQDANLAAHVLRAVLGSFD